jgi:hypothetical protein
VVIRWKTWKGSAAIILFLILAILVEYVVVLYAMSLGVQEAPEERIFGFISPLFHLIPLAVIVTLAFTWTYLTKHAAVRPREALRGKPGRATKQGKESQTILGRMKSGLLRVKGISFVWRKIHFARATVKSAFMVFLVFLTLVLVASLLAYPQLIYRTILTAYQTNPSLLNFVKGTGQALSSIGGVFSGINNAVVSAAPGLGDLGLSVGAVIAPLANLNNTGKYLVLQNLAAWVSSLAVLFYGMYAGRSYQYRKGRS